MSDINSLNKVILVGRLGKDPEVRHLDNGATTAKFSLATSERYKKKSTNDQIEKTEWHNIVLWRELAEVAEKYLHKGDLICVEGKIRTRSWEKEGVTRYTTEIEGNNITMLGGKREQTSSANPTTHTTSASNESTDDLPF